MKLFIDNNLSPLIAKSLHPLLDKKGGAVTHLSDVLPTTVKDAEIFQYLADADGDWTIFSSDRFRGAIERNILATRNLTYILAGKSFNKLALHLQISKIFLHIDEWEALTRKRGKWYECTANGKLKPMTR